MAIGAISFRGSPWPLESEAATSSGTNDLDHVAALSVVAASGDIGADGEPCQVIKGLIGGAFAPVKVLALIRAAVS
jgi:hypothetical protein